MQKLVPFPHDITNYFVVARKTGISYEIAYQGHFSALAYANKADRPKHQTIDLHRLMTGLKERRYRLVHKTQPSKAILRGQEVIHNEGFGPQKPKYLP